MVFAVCSGVKSTLVAGEEFGMLDETCSSAKRVGWIVFKGSEFVEVEYLYLFSAP